MEQQVGSAGGCSRLAESSLQQRRGHADEGQHQGGGNDDQQVDTPAHRIETLVECILTKGWGEGEWEAMQPLRLNPSDRKRPIS